MATKDPTHHFSDGQGLSSLERRCAFCKEHRHRAEYVSATGHYRYFRCLACRRKQGRERRARIGKEARSKHARTYYRRHKQAIKARRMNRYKRSPWMDWAIGSIAAKRRLARDIITIRWSHLKLMIETQGYKCAVTGLPFWSNGKTAGCPTWDSPSIDRLDPDGPYSPENIRIVLYCVNAFRGRMTDAHMLSVAKSLVAGIGPFESETGAISPSISV